MNDNERQNNIKLVYSCDEQSSVLPCEITILLAGRSDPPADSGTVVDGVYIDDDEKNAMTDAVEEMFRTFPSESGKGDKVFSKLRCEFFRQEFRTADILTVYLQVKDEIFTGEQLLDFIEKEENNYEDSLKAQLQKRSEASSKFDFKVERIMEGRGLIPKMRKNSLQYCNIAKYLSIDIGEDGVPEWPADWGGNLHLFREDIKIDKVKKPFHEHFQQDWKKLMHFFSHVVHLDDTPPRAKMILSYASMRPSTNALQKFNYMFDAANYCNYNPLVLLQDGWTLTPSDPADPSQKDNHIGKSVWWLNAEAVIIAYVHDDGEDFWRCKYVNDYETADLDGEEVIKALRAFENKRRRLNKQRNGDKGTGGDLSQAKSTRHGDPNFVVEGIEDGVVMAVSLNTVARVNVLWPARVMHASESSSFGEKRRKKQINHHHINVVFFAPYWIEVNDGSNNTSVPLFEYEAITCDSKFIRKYPFDTKQTLNINDLRTAFSFTGLPPKAFSMFVDAHRLAMGFKNFAASEREFIANQQQKIADSAISHASHHNMSFKTPLFPMALLNLPWIYILKKLDNISYSEPDDDKKTTSEIVTQEPVLQLRKMLNCLAPPFSQTPTDPDQDKIIPLTPSAAANGASAKGISQSVKRKHRMYDFCGKYMKNCFTEDIGRLVKKQLVKAIANFGDGRGDDKENGDENSGNASSYDVPLDMVSLASQFTNILQIIEEDVALKNDEADGVKFMVKKTLIKILQLKNLGEDTMISLYRDSPKEKLRPFVEDWRKTCESLYSFTRASFSVAGRGAGVSAVMSDSRCGNHFTGTQSYERSVRLSAALKGAKLAGAGTNEQHVLVPSVSNEDMALARHIIESVHDRRYINRIEHKVSMLSDTAKGEALTDDSDGDGGDDTGGSRGSWDAAICGVACALKAVRMVVFGEISNAFCATRPPGHHAGRDLRAMGAPSNGFCLLNTAAAAAKFAVLPVEQGGVGLRRVCVIDFDVHHGNGTQEALCSTYDPRFLYVSLHAGGVETEKHDDSDDDMDDFGAASHHRTRGKEKTQRGIFPGDCGDTSPHEGVLNIPLGWKVTPESFGMELMGTVKAAVKKFCPDLIVLSAGFDAHKNDPLGLGGLSSLDFSSITAQCCVFAETYCSGRVISILEGGYGVPCCQFTRQDLFLPKSETMPIEAYTDLAGTITTTGKKIIETSEETRKKINYLHNKDSLGYDEMSPELAKSLLKCSEEGFVECVAMHCYALKRSGNKTTKHPLLEVEGEVEGEGEGEGGEGEGGEGGEGEGEGEGDSKPDTGLSEDKSEEKMEDKD